MGTLPKFAEIIANPQSVAMLARGRGWNSDLVHFLAPFAVRNFYYKVFDFDEDTINNQFTVANSGGAAASNYAATPSVELGVVRGSTGTTDNGSIAFTMDAVMFDAARSPGMEMSSKLDAITNYALQMGFSDAPTNAYTLDFTALTAAAVPTKASNGVTDIAAIMVNTDFTLATGALVSFGTTDTTAAGALLGTFAHVAATYSVWRLQVATRQAFGIIDDNYGQVGRLATGPDTGILMAPNIICGAKAGSAARQHDIDYIRVWAERAY